jgi:CubicO group peptidase (beta-lactamase class C family)
MRHMPCRSSFAAFITLAVAIVLLGLSGCAHVPPPLPPVVVEPTPPPCPPTPPAPPETSEIDSPSFARIGQVAKREIAAGHVPGAVILVGHQGEIVYRKAFGLRAVEPCPVPMTVDTIFDLASLTKVVATTMAVMELVDQGSIKLDAPAATYWPE